MMPRAKRVVVLAALACWVGCTSDGSTEGDESGMVSSATRATSSATGSSSSSAGSTGSASDAESSSGGSTTEAAESDETAAFDEGDEGGEGDVVSEFALLDVNPTSATFEQPVSPRDHLEKVSGWYFTHAT